MLYPPLRVADARQRKAAFTRTCMRGTYEEQETTSFNLFSYKLVRTFKYLFFSLGMRIPRLSLPQFIYMYLHFMSGYLSAR